MTSTRQPRAGNSLEYDLPETPDTMVETDPAFRADVLRGLAEPVPAIPARWLYDRRGSELFDEITRLPAYYPTRTETALLETRAADIAARSTARICRPFAPNAWPNAPRTANHHVVEPPGP